MLCRKTGYVRKLPISAIELKQLETRKSSTSGKVEPILFGMRTHIIGSGLRDRNIELSSRGREAIGDLDDGLAAAWV